MKDGRHAVCFFCDDLRQEVGNKISLMGIYQEKIIIAAPGYPVILPKLVAYIVVSSPIEQPLDGFRVIIRNTDATELNRIDYPIPEWPAHLPPDARRMSLIAAIVLSPVSLSQAGYLEAWLEIAGEEERIGRLEVALAPQGDQPPTPVPPSPPPG